MSKPSLKQQVQALARTLGCKVEISQTSRRLDVTIDAPAGHIFSGLDTHSIVAEQHAGEDEAHVWRSLLSDLQGGLESCTIEDCDSCNSDEPEAFEMEALHQGTMADTMVHVPTVTPKATPVGGANWTYNDGGRKAAGYQGLTGDCVTRSIAIVTGLPYQEVYDAINERALAERPRKNSGRRGKRSNARTGVYKPTFRKYLEALGYKFVPTMGIGTGCKVHLKAEELPKGRLIVSVSKHLTAVIDGVIHDTFDPSREGTRCVYGYFIKEA